MGIDAIWEKARKASRTGTTVQPPQCEWTIPTLNITLALTLAIGIGFLVGDHAAFVAATVKVVAEYQDVFGATHHEIACFQERVKPSPQEEPYRSMLERSQRVGVRA
jgi:hypothetical protein